MPDDEPLGSAKVGETRLYKFSSEELKGILALAELGKRAAAEARPISPSYRFLKFDVDGQEETLSMDQVRTALDLAETIKLQSLPEDHRLGVSREDLDYYIARPYTPLSEWPRRIFSAFGGKVSYEQKYRGVRRNPRVLPYMARPLYRFVAFFSTTSGEQFAMVNPDGDHSVTRQQAARWH